MVPTRLLRVAAVGAVDDGKSTLIGRLLHDSKQLTDDQIRSLELASSSRGQERLNLSYATDGLRAEREQGITIDVAYRYAATENAKLVIADCPGHLVYTGNMASGASTADLALVVVDVTRKLRDQTRRHMALAILFGVRRLVVAVNKMDLVDWSEQAYVSTIDEVAEVVRRLGGAEVTAVPVSALHGDNVAAPSPRSPWYSGGTVMEYLRPAPPQTLDGGARLPVQSVGRNLRRRPCARGLLSGGPIAVGDQVVVLPRGTVATVAELGSLDGPVQRALPGRSIQINLDDGTKLQRGDMLADAKNPPQLESELRTTLCWFAGSPARAGDRFLLKHTTNLVWATVTAVEGLWSLAGMAVEPANQVEVNEIGLVRWAIDSPLAVDGYRSNRTTGSFIAIDAAGGQTLGAAMVEPVGPD